MAVLILHLSDIHIRNESDPILLHARQVAACTFSALPSVSHAFIVVSGDIAFSGLKEQYDLASLFFSEIRNHIESEKAIPISFVVVPGNHDCDFNLDNRMRQLAIKDLLESATPIVDDSVISQCTSVQRNYFDHADALHGSNAADIDRLWDTRVFEVEGKQLAFDCLNIAWVSKKHEDQGGLYFPYDRYSDKGKDGASVRILVMHHPLNWFGQAAYRPFRTFIRKLANIVMTGHEHLGNVGENIDAESGHSAYVEGCVLQGETDLAASSFNVININLDDGTFRSVQYAWSKDIYLATEEGSWSDYRELPIKKRSTFEVTQEFRATLDDPGAPFLQSSSPRLALSDIYVFPDVSEMSPEADKRTILSSSIFRDPAKTVCGVLIQAEEKMGCTSLLYRIFDEYHNRGFVPLYVHGKDLKKRTVKEIDSLIQLAIKNQYGSGAIARFEQVEATKKILLLDDFDESPLKAELVRASVLEGLRIRFGHIVVTVSELFEAKEMLEGTESEILRKFKHYRLLPMGYALRTKLIRKWFEVAVGSVGATSEGELIGKWDEAEKLVEAVLHRNIIPSAPLFLLTLLLSVGAGRSGDFKESALGFYYQYLITEGFTSAGVPISKLSEPFEFSTQLAWFFHGKKTHELTESNLREFNDFYSAKYRPGDFQQRIDLLVKANILVKRGDYYFFRYPYTYFFLKGRYISQKLTEPSIRGYITKCCTHLYVRENANTILFLAHFTTDEFVIDAIVSALHRLFDSDAPVTFSGDTAEIALLIENAPKLEYTGEKPEEHRKRISEMRDRHDDGSDGLLDEEEDENNLSVLAQLTVLYKTLEILGQVLKSQFARIERPRKVELIGEIFSGPLRALHSFYAYTMKNPDYLVAEIDAALLKRGNLKDEDTRQRVARRVVAHFVQAMSFSFLQKASAAVSGDVLRIDVQDAIKANGTLAFRLIENGLILDSPAPLPKAPLKKLIEDAKGDAVALRIIFFQVIHHLYMFKTSEADMQWLSSEQGLNYDLSRQHAIEFNTSNTKKLK